MSGSPKKITFSIGIPALVCGALATVAAFAWVFVLGVIMGRGHNPEDSIPELSKILPQAEGQLADNNKPRVIAEDTRQALEKAKQNEERSGALQKRPKDGETIGMMTPEELGFHTSVKRPSRSVQQQHQAAEQAAKPADKPAAEKPKAKEAQPPKKAESAKKPEQPKKPEQTKKDKPAQTAQAATKKPAETTKPTPQAKTDDKDTFNYVYQVASFKDLDQATALCAKLKGASLRARSEKSTDEKNVTWHRVLVDFKGKPEDTRKLRKQLEAQGFPKVLMRSKSPVK